MKSAVVFVFSGLFSPALNAAQSPFSPAENWLGQQSGRVIFASNRAGKGLALYSMAADGKDKQLVVPAAVRGRGEYEAAVSPDGKHLAFTTYRYGGWKIAVSDINGKNVRRVTMDPQYAYDPHWSPDGKSLMYRRIVNGSKAYFEGQGDIYKINIDGSGNTNVSDSPKELDRKAAWSPDGKWVVYDSFVGEKYDKVKVMLMKPDGSERHPVKGDSDAMFAPSWSPDGKWLAHLRADEDSYIDVWVMKTDGSEARNLTRSRERGLVPMSKAIRHWQFDTNWSANGRFITFVGDYAEPGNIDIYAVDVDGKHLSRLTTHKEDDVHPYGY